MGCRARVRIAAGLAGVLLLGVAVSARGVAAQPALPVIVTAVDTNAAPQVKLSVSVRREPTVARQPLPGEAFSLFEDGVRMPVQASSADGPLEVVILVDTANETDEGAGDLLVASALELLLGLPEGSEAAVGSFGGEPRLATELTADRSVTARALGELEAGSGTALHDALPAGLAALPSEPDARQMVVLLTTRGDTASGLALEEAARSLRGTGVSGYVLQLGIDGDPAVSGFTAQAGAQLLTADDRVALVAAADQVIADAADAYELTYASQANGDAEIRVAVDTQEVAGEAVTTVQFRDGPPAAANPAPAGSPTGSLQQTLEPGADAEGLTQPTAVAQTTDGDEQQDQAGAGTLIWLASALLAGLAGGHLLAFRDRARAWR